uniref:helix-turn-helix domain-containing protein n=1 Tax=Bacillus sp. WP8 TaxID=756828 RepID=UPI00119CA729
HPHTLIEPVKVLPHARSYLHPKLTHNLLNEFPPLPTTPLSPHPHHHLYPQIPTPLHILTTPQSELLQMLPHPKTNTPIAQSLFITHKTLKNHLTNIFQKINLNHPTQALLLPIKDPCLQIT